MLVVTDVAAVEAAFNKAAPRPIEEFIAEFYPGATRDRNGRYHAPYDGYVCSLTGQEFRGGEYLPYTEPDDNYRMIGTRKFPTAVDQAGNEYSWTGTRGQERAVWGELIAQNRAFLEKQSTYIGEVGQKVTLKLTIGHIHTYEGYYGLQFINIMTDENHNVVIYKGSKALGAKGSAITVACKVKAHVEREGTKQTVIERPKASVGH